MIVLYREICQKKKTHENIQTNTYKKAQQWPAGHKAY